MRFARTKYPAGARPLVVPDRHRLVEANDPCAQEYAGHVVVPRLDHLANGPELINEGRSLNVGELQVPIDALEAPLGHQGAEIVGAWVLLLVAGDGVVVPKLVNVPSSTS